jgi:nitrile hydratase accessory protein
LHANGAFTWETFRQELIAAITAAERRRPPRPWSYYDCWLTALERVVVAAGLLGAGDIERRAATLAARPAGHDHG